MHYQYNTCYCLYYLARTAKYEFYTVTYIIYNCTLWILMLARTRILSVVCFQAQSHWPIKWCEIGIQRRFCTVPSAPYSWVIHNRLRWTYLNIPFRTSGWVMHGLEVSSGLSSSHLLCKGCWGMLSWFQVLFSHNCHPDWIRSNFIIRDPRKPFYHIAFVHNFPDAEYNVPLLLPIPVLLRQEQCMQHDHNSASTELPELPNKTLHWKTSTCRL